MMGGSTVPDSTSHWWCGGCLNGPMIIGLQAKCVYCDQQRGVSSDPPPPAYLNERAVVRNTEIRYERKNEPFKGTIHIGNYAGHGDHSGKDRNSQRLRSRPSNPAREHLPIRQLSPSLSSSPSTDKILKPGNNALMTDTRLQIPQWTIVDYIKDQYEPGESLAKVLVIVGTATQAYCAPCLKYMQETWPKSGPLTLEALQIALVQGKYECMRTDSVLQSIDFTAQSLNEVGQFVSVALRGCKKDTAEIIEQFAFLTASLRLPRPDILSQSEVKLDSLGEGNDRLISQDLQSLDMREDTCWQTLFPGSILALGFQVPPRSGQIGIEIPYDIMASLARVLYPVAFDGGVLLKGYSTMLIPISCMSDCIQWHLLYDKERKRLTTASIKGRIENWYRTMQIDQLEGKRAFLGFCPKIKVLLATLEAQYESIDYSTSAKRKGKNVEVSGATAGFAFATQGLPGPTLGLNFTFSRNQAMTRNLIFQDHISILEDMKERAVILYDVDARKPCLVSMSSAVLHMIHVWAKRYPALANAEIPFIEATWDAGSKASMTMKSSLLLDLHDVPNSTPYTLMDLVKNLWGNLESAIETLEQLRPNGFQVQKPRTIVGWEFMDMITAKPFSRPKETRVGRTGGGWERLTDNVMTLFCSGLGDVIVADDCRPRCTQACLGCLQLPETRREDYMVASVSTIKSLSSTCGSGQTGRIRLTEDTCLFPPSNYADSTACSQSPDKQCDSLYRIVKFSKREARQLPVSLYTVVCERLAQGAIVIGDKPLLHQMHRIGFAFGTAAKRQKNIQITTQLDAQSNQSSQGAPITEDLHEDLDLSDVAVAIEGAEGIPLGSIAHEWLTDNSSGTEIERGNVPPRV